MAVLLTFAGSAVVFFLYGLPPEPFAYVFMIVAVLGAVTFTVAYIKGLRRAERREQMIRSALTEAALPLPESFAEEDYQTVVALMRDELTRLRNDFEIARQEETDFYTAWVHQIKTPIAVMRMELGGDEAPDARALETELFRIEQYADMVLQYVRLGGEGNDLVIKEYPLDELIREAIRKFAPQFVAKRLGLSYDGTDVRIVTDKKWFSVILEQIISNAIKYTPTGNITVRIDDGTLTIADTGIGIAPEDIPRIFEKGFTGENGRLEKRSSGLGLYLCRKAAELLNIPLSVNSTVGRGSVFSFDLNGKIGK